MKSLNQIDLDDWELLPDEGFLEINDDGSNRIYSRKYPQGSVTSVFEMNYFICPSKQSPEFHPIPKQLIPLPIHLDPTPRTLKPRDDGERVIEEVTKIPVEMMIAPPEKIKSFSDQDPVSQVFFKKMKETEFVDMKVDSPKSSWGIMPQIDGAGAFLFEEKGDDGGDDDDRKEVEFDSDMAIKNEKNMELDVEGSAEGEVSVWKWSLTGIGAICSFGVVAAATFCIIFFSHRPNKHPRQNQKLQFQIYSTDKRVTHQASKLKDAISAVRGVPVPISRAHITCGGYCGASL